MTTRIMCLSFLRLSVLLVLVLPLALGGCGRKGPLEPPPAKNQVEKKQ